MQKRTFRKLCSGALLILGGSMIGITGGASPLPPEHDAPHGARFASPSDYGWVTPTPVPVLPKEMDVFTPPLLGNSSGPQVAEFTHTAGPDETLTVAGPDFTADTRFHFYGQTRVGDAVMVETAPCVTRAIAASVILPAQLPAWPTYLVWPNTGSTYGKPVAVNRTEAWWLGCDQALPGETVSVYGRNLSHGNGTGSSWIYVKRPGNTEGVWVNPTSVNPYRVSFKVPSIAGQQNVDATGACEVWTHNGHGGQFGWSGPLILTVISQSPWAGQDANVFNVKTYGAAGDGVTDDTQSIQSALDAAGKAAPATLYFPKGTYIVDGMIDLRNNVSWLGDDRDTTAIKAGPAFASSVQPGWQALIFSDSETIGHIEFKNLFFDGHGTLGDKKGIMLFRHHDFVKVTNCRFNWKGSPNGFNVGSNHYLTIANNEFIGDQVFLGNSKQVVVRDNDFRLTDFANAAVISWGGNEVAIVNNRARDDDPAAAAPGSVGAGRFFVAQCHPDSNRHFYIGDNTTSNMAPPVDMGDSNQGEQILFEVGTSTFAASPVATTPTTAGFASAPPTVTLQDAVVLKGRGTGQFRRVTAVNGNTITVAPPWSVIPDETSVIGVGPAQTRTVVYHNQLDGKRDYPTYETASVAISMYGNVSDLIFAENKITHMRTGLADEFSQASDPSTPTPSALYFNLIAHNTVDGAYRGMRVVTDFLTEKSGKTWGHLGNTYRGNVLKNMTLQGIFFGADRDGYPGGSLEQDVFEHNVVTNVPTAISVGKMTLQANPPKTRFNDLIFYKNTFALGAAEPARTQAMNLSADLATYWACANQWLGFKPIVEDVEKAPETKVDPASH